MVNKKERKALKQATKAQIEEKKAQKEQNRKEIEERREQHGGMTIGHHCPHKEQARTHALNEKRCVEKGHVGYCPTCFNLVAYVYGCSIHYFKKKDLLTKKPKNWQKLKAENADKGLLGPGGIDARNQVGPSKEADAVEEAEAEVAEAEVADAAEDEGYDADAVRRLTELNEDDLRILEEDAANAPATPPPIQAAVNTPNAGRRGGRKRR